MLCHSTGKPCASLEFWSPRKLWLRKTYPSLIPGIRVTQVCSSQPHFFGTQKLPCRSSLSLTCKYVYANVSVPCFPTMEKALETKEEKLVFPPEQHACLPYIDKLSHGLQGCISTVWAGTSSQSYHLGKGCSYRKV